MGWSEQRKNGNNHYCSLIRERMGIVPKRKRMPPMRHPQSIYDMVASYIGKKKQVPNFNYNVDVKRFDYFWNNTLKKRHIDFLKIDVDMPPKMMGLKNLIKHRGFSVMSIEIDGSWNSKDVSNFVTHLKHRRYKVFLKVPCLTR